MKDGAHYHSQYEKALTRLAESAQHYRSLFDHNFDAVYSLDLDGIFTTANHAVEKMSGYTRDEIIGMPFTRHIDPQHHEARLRNFRRAAAGETVNYDTVVIRKNGEQAHANVTHLPIIVDGAVVGIYGIARDITDRKRHEHELAQQASLLDKAQDAIMVRDLDHRVLFWNQGAERMYGWSAQEAVGKPVTQLMVREPRILDTAMAALHASGEWKGELDHVTRDGQCLTVEAHWTLVRDAAGKPEKILAINTDVTDRKEVLRQVERLNTELEERVQLRTRQLEEAIREMEAFSYSVSHDLRAPLNTIAGFSQILARNAGTQLSEREQHYLDRIRHGVRQMSELIDALLVLAKITRMKPRREQVDFSRIAGEVAEIIDEDARQRQRSGTVSLSVHPGMQVAGDPRLLRQALMNLLGNAWKFTGKTAEPRVEVGMQAAPGEPPVYFVRDNGAGFDMAYAERLFGAFQRLHPAREFEGTGIGLATVQRIISLHGGRIWAQGTPDHGATFYFTLPDAGDTAPSSL